MKISLFKVSLILLLIIIACLLALNLISRFHLLLEKIPGSFEYVRTGEDFAKKGDYKAAVSYFEKANSASPGNRSIKSSLVYAYTKWGEYVADDGRYDEAIEYLKKAYEAIQDTSTIQNLAFMYSKKALDEARRNAWLDATEDYARSRAIAQDSDIARKNLSISLFNDSVSEYKIAEDNIAILCLKESSLAYEEPKTFEFLGDIYYKKTELDKALFYWDKARELVPDNKDISEKLEKLAKEMVLGKTASVKEYPHFELRLGGGFTIDSDVTSDILEKAYFDVGKDLAYFPKNKTVVFFYSQESFREIFALPYAVMSFYDGNIRMPLPDKPMHKDEFRRYIYHEYAHAVVSAKTNNNCPTWLNEGMAVWEELKAANQNMTGPLPKGMDIPNISINSLDRIFRTSKDNATLSASYLVSCTIVQYIVDNWGIGGLQDLLVRIGTGQHVMNAIDDEFLLSEKEFEKRWKEYVKKRYGV